VRRVLRQSHSTHVLIRDDLDTDYVPGSLEDLFEDVFGDSRVKPAHVQCPFVRFWCRSTDHSSRGRRQCTARSDGGRNVIIVLWDDDRRERWRTHGGGRMSITARRRIITRCASCRRWRGQCHRRNVFRHVEKRSLS
jgi:hypothetical protein